MAVIGLLGSYELLESMMMGFDSLNSPLAEQLRDAMDPIWYALTDDEHAYLNHRTIALPPTPQGIGLEMRAITISEATVRPVIAVATSEGPFNAVASSHWLYQ